MCPKEGQRSIMNKYRKGFYGILLLTLTMLFGMTAQAKTDDTIKTGIYAGDVELSGMTAQEATAVIEEHIESLKNVESTLLAANDHDVTTTAGDLGVTWKNPELVQEAVELDINLQALAVLRDCLRLMQADIRRPLQPRTIIKMRLDRHEQRILWQPRSLLLHKCPEILRLVFPEAGERRLQHMKPLVIHLPEINLIVALRPLYTLQRLSCQPALFHQLFWVNQIRIARKR